MKKVFIALIILPVVRSPCFFVVGTFIGLTTHQSSFISTMIKRVPSVLTWCCWTWTTSYMFLRMPPTTRALGVASQRYQRQRGGVPITHQVYGWASSRAAYTTITTSAMGGTAGSEASASATTQYTIDCPPTDPETLNTVVTKHVNSLDRYLSKKPIAGHTRAAFDQLQQQNPDLLVKAKDSKLILDSGCGTGRSSLVLGELYPESFVIGVDRSMVRLRKNPKVPRNRSRNPSPSEETSSDDNEDESDQNILVQQVADNVWLVRAELVDFWHCLLEYDCRVQHHYMLYPNPYPKSSRLKQRWYAHPSFPLLLHLSGDRLTVRSNWQQYLEEFKLAAEVVASLECSGLPVGSENPAGRFFRSSTDGAAVPATSSKPTVVQRSPSAQASWTNFEAKYDDVGEATFELVLQASTFDKV
jgi:tRNA (guanine-N7-)-methyltransferase